MFKKNQMASSHQSHMLSRISYLGIISVHIISPPNCQTFYGFEMCAHIDEKSKYIEEDFINFMFF